MGSPTSVYPVSLPSFFWTPQRRMVCAVWTIFHYLNVVWTTISYWLQMKDRFKPCWTSNISIHFEPELPKNNTKAPTCQFVLMTMAPILTLKFSFFIIRYQVVHTSIIFSSHELLLLKLLYIIKILLLWIIRDPAYTVYMLFIDLQTIMTSVPEGVRVQRKMDYEKLQEVVVRLQTQLIETRDASRHLENQLNCLLMLVRK